MLFFNFFISDSIGYTITFLFELPFISTVAALFIRLYLSQDRKVEIHESTSKAEFFTFIRLDKK